jgi:hypothetical protein
MSKLRDGVIKRGGTWGLCRSRAGSGDRGRVRPKWVGGFATEQPLHATTLLLAGVPVHVVANRLGRRPVDQAAGVRARAARAAAGAADVSAQAGEAVSGGVGR